MAENPKPLVSISCITYNHAPYIRECLEGFLMQKTNFPFEILIHDDASTDGTADIIREYQTEYPDLIKPILREKNLYSQGIRCINRFNIERAHGKYIAFCEGDDFWTDPHKLQIQFDFMEEHPDYSMCFAQVLQHRVGSSENDTIWNQLENREYSSSEIYQNWLVPTCTVFLKKSIYKSLRCQKLSSDNRFIYGDLPLWLVAATEGKLRGMNIVVGQYNRHPGGMTATKQTFEFLSKLVIYNEALRELFPEIKDLDNHFVSGLYYALCKKQLRRANIFAAISMFRKSCKFSKQYVFSWLNRDLKRMLHI